MNAASGADTVVLAIIIKFMLSKRAERNDFAILCTHFFDYFRHQLFAHPLSLQTRIDIRMFNDAQVLARRHKDDFRDLVTCGIIDIKFVVAFLGDAANLLI